MDNHLYQVKYRHASDWVCPGGCEPVVPLGNFWAHCTDTESDWGGGDKQRGRCCQLLKVSGLLLLHFCTAGSHCQSHQRIAFWF